MDTLNKSNCSLKTKLNRYFGSIISFTLDLMQHTAVIQSSDIIHKDRMQSKKLSIKQIVFLDFIHRLVTLWFIIDPCVICLWTCVF
jgi:hypothetical protein